MAVAYRCNAHPIWGNADIVLASQSPRRVELCNKIGIIPEHICPADIDETPHPSEKPADYARRMAVTKARTIASDFPRHVIIAADTVVCCGRRILDKTENAADAHHCLVTLSGRTHQVLGGVCVISPDGQADVRLSKSVVKMKRLSKLETEAYIAGGEWQGKAGGYAIQGQAEQFIRSIQGSYANIVGLDVYMLSAMLAAIGFRHDPDSKI